MTCRLTPLLIPGLVLIGLATGGLGVRGADVDAGLRAGFGEADVSPDLGPRPVYMAGFGQNRKATRVHDPIMARALVLRDGDSTVAIACADVIGLFHPSVERIRAKLPGFNYVLVSSTHNHEGADTMGLWGPNPFTAGVDPAYLRKVEDGVVRAVRRAEAGLRPVIADIGTRRAPHLLVDTREPFVKHDELVAIRFREPGAAKPVGIVVQWNCHPETLDGGNTEVSSDFVGPAVTAVADRFHCPVVYLTGTVGGLMTSLRVPVKDAGGNDLKDGTFEKTEAYGKAVAGVAAEAVGRAVPVRLTPLRVRRRDVYLPLENRLYQLARHLGVIDRRAYLWAGDPTRAEPVKAGGRAGPLCLRTEIAWLALGELDVVAIPGEVYPELVLGNVQDPPDPGADFPDAPVEPALYAGLPGKHRMIVGLANDEIGYIIPKRQWDAKPPYCYGRTRPQYGEVNSVGPEAAPLLCGAFRELVTGGKKSGTE